MLTPLDNHENDSAPKDPFYSNEETRLTHSEGLKPTLHFETEDAEVRPPLPTRASKSHSLLNSQADRVLTTGIQDPWNRHCHEMTKTTTLQRGKLWPLISRRTHRQVHHPSNEKLRRSCLRHRYRSQGINTWTLI